MVLTDFTIKLHEDDRSDRHVRVVVYDSLKGLRIAASRYDNRSRSIKKKINGGYADTVGLCQRFQQGEVVDGEFVEDQLCAIVRLARPHLGVGLIAHEMTHAAVWIMELNEANDALTCENDEPFCWLVGELTRQAVIVIGKLGVLDEVS